MGLIAVAVCLLLLLLVLILVYCRKKEGLDSDVADSSILTSGFQPVSIKPSKAGGVPLPPTLARPPHHELPVPPQCHTLSLSLPLQTIPTCSPSSQTSAPPPPPARAVCVPGRTGQAPSSSSPMGTYSARWVVGATRCTTAHPPLRPRTSSPASLPRTTSAPCPAAPAT